MAPVIPAGIALLPTVSDEMHTSLFVGPVRAILNVTVLVTMAASNGTNLNFQQLPKVHHPLLTDNIATNNEHSKMMTTPQRLETVRRLQLAMASAYSALGAWYAYHFSLSFSHTFLS